jgi:RNA polymerase sigma-70 factor (ECF subfamily)
VVVVVGVLTPDTGAKFQESRKSRRGFFFETLRRTAQYKGHGNLAQTGAARRQPGPAMPQPMEDDIRQRLDARQYSEAFELLFERFKDKIFRLAYSMMHNETLAEDATQDAFVRIWKGLPGYHGGASLSTWIYTITRNTCLTELKKSSRRPTVSLQDPEMEEAADRIASLQTTDADPGSDLDVETLLAQLPEKYRRVITLFYLEQKSYEEVAAMLGLPLGTVKVFLFRAKKELLRIGSRRAPMRVTTPGAETETPTRGPTTTISSQFADRRDVANSNLMTTYGLRSI